MMEQKNIKKHPIEILSNLYPQICLPVRLGMSKSKVYKDIVSRGIIPNEVCNGYTMSSFDRLVLLPTQIGEVTAVYFFAREDFERFIQVMRYKCEPTKIPSSIGAMLITGITSWTKIYTHKENYEQRGGQNWNEEFQRFTSIKENYTDSLIIISRGSYSNIDVSSIQYDSEKWENISFEIRIYHELAHYVRRKLSKVYNPILDEVIADCVGMLFAIGNYDISLAKTFLGIEDLTYRKGSRLEYYIKEKESLNEIIEQANLYIHILYEFLRHEPKQLYDTNHIVELIEKLYGLKFK